MTKKLHEYSSSELQAEIYRRRKERDVNEVIEVIESNRDNITYVDVTEYGGGRIEITLETNGGGE